MAQGRVSIGWLMGLVVLAAINCALWRVARRDEEGFLILAGLLPMADGVVIGLAVLVLGLRRPGGAPSFWVGFTAVGLGAMALFLFGLCLEAAGLGPSPLAWYFESIAMPLSDAIAPRIDPGWAEVMEIAIVGLLFTLPQAALALFGGWLTRHYRVALVCLGPRAQAAAPMFANVSFVPKTLDEAREDRP